MPTRAERAALDRLLAATPRLQQERARRAASKFRTYFPDQGPLRRALYGPHVAWMAAGAQHRERLFMAANRCGKTETAGYEAAVHMTGLYPDWWVGRRFPKPVKCWFAGDTRLTTRDILQKCLLGDPEGVPRQDWTGGLLPYWLVRHITRASGSVANCVEDVYVQHHGPDGQPDGLSRGQFKSYDMGRRAFQGTEQDVIWCDEEPPDSNDEDGSGIYLECVLRTMTTDGMIMVTFTPLRGLTKFVQTFLQTADTPAPGGGLHNAYQHFFPEEVGG